MGGAIIHSMMMNLHTFELEAAVMNLVRTAETRKLIEEAVESGVEENLINVSFMVSPKQKAVIEKLSKENRFSQGVVVRIILDEWMQSKVAGIGQ